MKKIMLLVAGIAALNSVSTAQVNLSFSPEAGINLANLHQKLAVSGQQSQNSNGGIKLGVRAGVNADIWLGDRISIQPGIFYSIKGTKFTDEQNLLGITASREQNITLHYFDIPINVEYYFNDPSEGRFFVGVGGYMGVAFSGKSIEKVSIASTSVDTNISYKFGNDYPSNNLRRFDFGVAANVGYLLRSGIFFRGMYQLGLSNMFPQGNRPMGDDSKMTSSTFTISVGYMLGNKPKDKGPRMKGSAPM